MEEIVEYLHWITAIACKMYLENKPEAKILFEAVRRIAKQINNERSFGIQIFATAFVDPMSDFILSNYPWALIYDSGSKSKYVVSVNISGSGQNVILVPESFGSHVPITLSSEALDPCS